MVYADVWIVTMVVGCALVRAFKNTFTPGSMFTTLLSAAGGSLAAKPKAPTPKAPTPETTTTAPAPRTWTSKDPRVGETATAIEAKFPGRVKDLNVDVFRPDGSKLTDFDIELDTIVIQMKAGTGKRLTEQMTRTATGTEKTVTGYTPDLNPTSALVKGAQAKGLTVLTDLQSLLDFIGDR
jgi:hypothetical protein